MPRPSRLEVCLGERTVLEVVEHPQFLLEQEGAVEAAGGMAYLVQRGELPNGLALGRFEQRPAYALARAALARLALARGVRRRAGELDEVEGVKADFRGEVRATACCWRMAFS